MRRLSVAAALVILGALAFAGSARACSCAPVAPGEALRQADAAIVGELVKVIPLGDGRADFRYRVRGVYKGRDAIDSGRILSVQSTNHSAACGLPQGIGRRYGLLLAESEGGWAGGLCGLIEPRKLRSVAGQGSSQRKSGSGDSDSGCPS